MKKISRYVEGNRPPPHPKPDHPRDAGLEFGWTGRLKPGERLLWSGRPDASGRPILHPVAEPAARWALAAVCGGVVLALLYTVLPRIGRDSLSLTLVLAMVAVILFGLWYVLGGQPRWNRFWLERTRYALTDRRAIIARRVFRRYWTASFPIAKMTPARLVDLGRVGHVMFKQGRTATSYSTISKGMVLAPGHYGFGFRFLPDAPAVHRRLAALQSASSKARLGQAKAGPAP